MDHHVIVVTEMRDLEPEDGWARSEKTGRACVVCPCGLDTGFVPLAEASTLGQAHVHGARFPRPVTFTLQLEGADRVLAETVKQALRKE